MCVTSYGTEILQSQLNRSEKRRRCTHRNESPCLLRVDGKDGVVFLWFCAVSVPPVGFVHSARGYTSSGRSSANEAKPLCLHPAAPEEGKQEKQGKPLHGNVFFFFSFPSHCLSHQVHLVAKVPGTETDTRMRSCANLK